MYCAECIHWSQFIAAASAITAMKSIRTMPIFAKIGQAHGTVVSVEMIEGERGQAMHWSEAEYHDYLLRAFPTIALPASQTTGNLPIAEEQFLAKIIACAKKHSWLWYHTHDSRRSASGFPDLVLVREVLIFAECKTSTGKLTQEQATWLSMLERTGQVEVYTWRPENWEKIQERLTRKEQP
jgi:hypothetical protein